MTISTTDSRISYNGNGVTTVFAFPYRFLTNGDIVVLSVSAAGVETTKALTTDYTLTGAGDDAGGSVTMLVAPAVGTRLVIYRDTAVTQETDYISGDPFPAETHERALDRLTMIAQERESDIGRSIKVPVGDSSSLSTTLPASASRIGKFLVFDASGQPSVSAGTGTDSGLREDLADTTQGAGMVLHDYSRVYPVKSLGLASYGRPPATWAMTDAQVADVVANTASLDVAAALNTIIDTGYEIDFAPGTYGITAPLTPLAQQTLIGRKRAKAIIKAIAGFSGAAMVSYPSGSYSGVTIENLLLNGNAIAAQCLSMIGATQGSVDQIILRDVQCSLATTTQVYLENLTYSDLDHLLANGGTDYALHLKNCYTSVIKHGVFYHGTTAAVFEESCSDVEMYRTTLFNNSGTTSTSLLKIDGGHASRHVGCTFEPQGAANVTQEVLLQDTVSGSCADISFDLCEFIGGAGTKTRCMVVGSSGNVYKLVLDRCRFLKPTGNESILLTNQAECQISRSMDIVTYDTAVYAPVTVLNNSGNSYYVQNRLDQFVTLQTSGLLTAKDRVFIEGASGATGYTKPLILGSYSLWVDSTGDLRIKGSVPISDTDGAVVGTQT